RVHVHGEQLPHFAAQVKSAGGVLGSLVLDDGFVPVGGFGISIDEARSPLGAGGSLPRALAVAFRDACANGQQGSLLVGQGFALAVSNYHADRSGGQPLSRLVLYGGRYLFPSPQLLGSLAVRRRSNRRTHYVSSRFGAS